MTAAIICDGDFPRKPYPRYLISTADIIICCDGALRSFLKAVPSLFPGRERRPDAVVGDMDSLPARLRKEYESIVVKEDEQDYNDLTKAVRYLLASYPRVQEINILGATGKRTDHTIGNVSLLMEYGRMFPQTKGMQLEIVSDYETIVPLWNSCRINVGVGRRVSILSPDNGLKIKSSGLQYDTSGVVFDNWWKATLNTATEDEISLEFNKPSAAVLIMN